MQTTGTEVSPQELGHDLWASGLYAEGVVWVYGFPPARRKVKGPALFYFVPQLLFGQAKGFSTSGVLTPTSLFSGSLCRTRVSQESPFKSVAGMTAKGAGVTMNWKSFWHRSQSGSNHLGWGGWKQLLSSSLVKYLPFGLLELTQRETDLPGSQPRKSSVFLRLTGHSHLQGQKGKHPTREACLLSSRVSACCLC